MTLGVYVESVFVCGGETCIEKANGNEDSGG